MDNRWSPGVKEVKAFQNLSAPTSEDFGFHHLEALKVAVHRIYMVSIPRTQSTMNTTIEVEMYF